MASQPAVKSFAVVGGDLRQVHLAGLLAADGYHVLASGFDRDVEVSKDIMLLRSAAEAVQKADCVVLPLPCSVDGANVNAPFARASIPLEELFGAAAPGTLFAGGRISARTKELAAAHGVRLADYYEREELAVLNTIPTAEGAIQIAMEELPITIHDANCLVTGFGRVAKTLCADLHALGARVSACARKYADLAWMKTLGYTPVKIGALPAVAGGFDVVFNTVPAVLLTEDVLGKLRRGCLVIDLASKPGGVDFETAGRMGIKTVWALSLPGKVAPITAGTIIRDTVLNIITEEESV